jgi:hypothetical protein
MGVVSPNNTYTISNQRMPKGPHKLGVAKEDKLYFDVVEEAKDRRIFSKKCLQAIHNFDIISLKYQAWGCKVKRIRQGG